MIETDRTKEELIAELEVLRRTILDLRSKEAVQKQAGEDVFRLQEANYTAIFNAANDGIFINDIETGQITDVNNKACEMFCYPKEGLVGLNASVLSAGEGPYTAEEMRRFFERAAQGEPQLFEWMVKDKAGRLFWIEVNLKRAVIGGRYRLLAVVRDITERKEADEALELAQFSIERAGDGILWIGMDARLLYANDMITRSLGYSREELVNMTVYDIDPNFSKEDWPARWQELKERRSITLESKLRRKDGSVFPVELTINYLEFQGEEYDFAFVRDITERKKQESALLRRDYQLEILSRTSQHINTVLEISVIMRTLVAAAMELVGAKGGTGGLLVNGRMEFKEYNQDGTLQPINYAPETGASAVPAFAAKTVKAYISNDSEHDANIISEKQKAFGIYNLVCVPILGGKGELLGCLEIHNKEANEPFDAQDIFMLQGQAASAAVALENAWMLVEREKTGKELLNSEKRYRAIIEDQTELICRFNRHEIITFVNEAYCRYFGKSREELTGKSFLPLIPSKDRKRVRERIASIDIQKPSFTHEHRVITPDGKIRWQQWTNRAIFDENGKIIEIQAVGRDITERKETEEKLAKLYDKLVESNTRLKQLALKDTETGLYNHHYFGEILRTEFYRAKRYSHPLSIIMIDMDYFKSINNLYGHKFGDMVLGQFARQLRKLVRRYDIVIRFGGEEFIVICSDADRAKAVFLAERLLNDITMHNFGTKQYSVKLRMSIAVVSYPEDRVTKKTDFVDLAEKILEKVKEDGGNRAYSTEEVASRKAGKEIKHPGHESVKTLREKIEKLSKSGKQNLIESIFAFAKAIELKDHYTGEHVESTVHYATEIARALGLPLEDIENIREASILHDLGKIGVSDKILLKTTKLTKKEFEEIKKHPQIAADIIRPIQFMHDIIPLVLYHHERWDGKGYPASMRHEEIPLGARIIAVADVYQALISNRPYRKAYSQKKALSIIKRGAGIQFDPQVVEVFLRVLKEEETKQL